MRVVKHAATPPAEACTKESMIHKFTKDAAFAKPASIPRISMLLYTPSSEAAVCGPVYGFLQGSAKLSGERCFQILSLCAILCTTSCEQLQARMMRIMLQDVIASHNSHRDDLCDQRTIYVQEPAAPVTEA